MQTANWEASACALVTELKGFVCEVSSLDRIWNVLFPDRTGRWRHLHVVEYRDSHYLTRVDDKSQEAQSVGVMSSARRRAAGKATRVLHAMIPLLCATVPGWLAAATLDASTSLDTYPALPLQGGTQNVLVTNSLGFYDFGDRNGDGTRDDAVSPAGLTMGANSLYSAKNNSSSIRLNLNGGNLTATAGYMKTANAQSTGDIIIYNVGAFYLGDGYLDTGGLPGNYGGNWDPNGSICIGQDGVAGPRAGRVEVGGLSTKSTTHSKRPGDIVIHSTGDVLVRSAGGAPRNLATDADQGHTPGLITIRHDGMFTASNVTATSVWGNPADLLFDGDALADGASGTFTANRIDTHDTSLAWGAYGGRPGSITISNYTAVTLGSIDTRKKSGNGRAGSLVVGGIGGDVTITGTVNLDGYLATSDGDLTLSAGGIIQMADLDLDLVGAAALTAGQYSFVTGVLTNFNRGNPAASGLLEGNGGTIFYDPVRNPDLLAGGGGGVYALSRGTLKPKLPTGTTAIIR